MVGEIVAYGSRDLVAKPEILLHLDPAEVEVAILQPNFFVRDSVFSGRKRRRLRLVEQQQFGGDDLDLAGIHARVFEARFAAAHRADSGDDILGTRGLGLGVGRGR